MATSSRIHPELGKEEAKQSLAFFNWNMVFRTPFDSICAVSGFIFVDYALSLGIAKEKMGLFTSLVYLACLFQVVGLWVTNHIRDRKRFVLFFGVIEPVVVIIAVLAALAAPQPLRFPLLVALIFIAASAIHLTRPTTDEWLAAAIPERIRGRFLGRRFQISSIVMIVVTLVMGLIAEHIDRGNSLGFALFLAAGGIFGLLAVAMYRGATMPKTSAESRLAWSDVPQILRHTPFVRFLAGNLLYNVPFWLGAAYYQVVHLKVLGLRESAIAYLLIGSFVIKILFSPLCGRLVDRLGARKMIYLITPSYVGFFFLYAICNAHSAWMVFVAWALIGVGDAVFNVASTSSLYRSVQGVAARQAFFAFYNLFAFFLAALGAAAGALIVSVFKDTTFALGPFTLGPFNVLYGICFLIFLPCILGTSFFPGKE